MRAREASCDMRTEGRRRRLPDWLLSLSVAFSLPLALMLAVAPPQMVLADDDGVAVAQARSGAGASSASESHSAAAMSSAVDSAAEATSAASRTEAIVLADCPVERDTSFGGVYIRVTIDEFNAMGFAFGDCLDVVFSTGYEVRGIPYLSGYYVNVGDPLLVGYPGYPYVEVAINYGDPMWDLAGLREGDTATVTLVEQGKFRDVQEAFAVSYERQREDYPNLTDAQFANFRPLAGGELASDLVYRSASPICISTSRAGYVEAAMEDAGVAYVLDLSDNADEIAGFMDEAAEGGEDVSYFAELLETGCVAELDLSANYPSQQFAEKLAAGLVDMTEHDGPYLIHCIEGKDRTGFVCMLLEALAGATYDELAHDYMLTYANYYGITAEDTPSKYDAILHLNLDGMLRYLAGAEEGDDLAELEYSDFARDYLVRGGMTEEQVDALVEKITAPGREAAAA